MVKSKKPRKRSKEKKLIVGRKRKSAKSRKIKNKKLGFKETVSHIKNHVRGGKPNTVGDAIKLVLKSAKSIGKKIRPTRIVNVSKILPLIPIFARLSALGTLSGGAAAIAKAVNSTKSAKEKLEEAKRHNKSVEAIALSKGLYLGPYKTGLGLFLHQANSKN